MELLVICLVLTGAIQHTSGIMCSQCDSDIDSYCLENPPIPSNCTVCVQYETYADICSLSREVPYCIIEKRYINDTMIRITRDCSPAPMPEMCEHITQYATLIRVCYTTCKYNGCNTAIRHTIYPSFMYHIIAMVYIIGMS